MYVPAMHKLEEDWTTPDYYYGMELRTPSQQQPRSLGAASSQTS
jgi:hypothetical protein